MDKISDVKILPLSESQYLRPVRVEYNQNGKTKLWDAMKIHDSVVIVIHNISRHVLVFVKQFRPAVYISVATIEEQGGCRVIDTDRWPGSVGVTHELCAGIVDKDKPLAEIAKEEILEETGYDVPLESLEKITSYRSGVGTTGAHQTMYYVEVTDKMKVSQGGGNIEEGEYIELAEIPAADCLKFAMNEAIQKPMGMLFGLLWFHQNKLCKMSAL